MIDRVANRAWRMASVGCLIGLLASAAYAQAPAEPLPTSAELHKMFDDGQYQPLLTKLAKVLPLKGAAGAPYDMVDLSMLKTNTLLQMKQQEPAVRASADAVRLITPKTDPAEAAQAQALQTLLKYSKKLEYTPKTGAAADKPISLLDMKARDSALAALLDDLKADVATKSAAAKSSGSLPPILTAIATLKEMRPVEVAVTKSDAFTVKTGADLITQAQTLLENATTPMVTRVTAIHTEADRIVDSIFTDNNGQQQRIRKKQGIENSERNELKNMIDTFGKIQSACGEFAGMSKDNAAAFQKIATTAATASREASTILTTNYNAQLNQGGRQR